MKSGRGITLISLIIYIIVFSIVIGTVTMITNYFTKNIDEAVISVDTPEQYSRFTSYLIEDINSVNLDKGNISVTDENTITLPLLDGTEHKYLYQNNEIYYIETIGEENTKYIKLCSNISACIFSYENSETTRKLQVSITIDGNVYNNVYIIK